MMKPAKFWITVIICCSLLPLSAQKYITKTGVVEILSEIPFYTFKGVNNKVGSILDAEIGEVVASTLVRSFIFEKAVVEERFIGHLLDPEKFPSASFQGKITDYKKIDFSKNGKYNITIEGKLKINGITRYIKERGTLTLVNGLIYTETAFRLKPADYKINTGEDHEEDEVLLTIHFIYHLYYPE